MSAQYVGMERDVQSIAACSLEEIQAVAAQADMCAQVCKQPTLSHI
jgi:hypothetical protein